MLGRPTPIATGGQTRNQLRQQLLLMAGHVESMIAASMRALAERDRELACSTIGTDAKVNTAECEIDELCLRILADEHPVGADLRFTTLALKMVTDLERIGDLAVNICERAIELAGQPRLRTFDDIYAMAALVQSMVRDAIDAFVEGDADKANRVIARDDEVDELYHRAFRETLEVMRTDPQAIERAVHFQAVAKWLERMADHSTNLAEQVIFLIHGRDVRHEGKLVDGSRG